MAGNGVYEMVNSVTGYSVDWLDDGGEVGEEGSGGFGAVEADDLEVVGDGELVGAGVVEDGGGVDVVGGEDGVDGGMLGEEVVDSFFFLGVWGGEP